MTTHMIVAGLLNFLSPLFFQTDIPADAKQIECLATNIYFESAVESREGKRAVAHVTLNRLDDPAYEFSLCKVVQESFLPGTKACQFSWTCDGKSDVVPLDTKAEARRYQECVEEAIFAYFGLTEDPTRGATFYYNPALADPKWARSAKLKETVVIGNHRFMADKDDLRRFNNPVERIITIAINP